MYEYMYVCICMYAVSCYRRRSTLHDIARYHYKPLFHSANVRMYIRMYVCMYYVYMSFPQMRHCNIAPLHQLGFCHNNVTVDNTFRTCFGGGQVGIQNK